MFHQTALNEPRPEDDPVPMEPVEEPELLREAVEVKPPELLIEPRVVPALAAADDAKAPSSVAPSVTGASPRRRMPPW